MDLNFKIIKKLQDTTIPDENKKKMTDRTSNGCPTKNLFKKKQPLHFNDIEQYKVDRISNAGGI